MHNKDIAKILYEMSKYFEMKDDRFRARAYDAAAEVIGSLQESVRDIYASGDVDALTGISGVGKGIAGNIEEYITTGKVSDYEKLKKEIPVDLADLIAIEGIGPKSVKHLYDALGIRTVDDLEKAAKEGKIRSLKGFGEKSEAKILRGIAFLRDSGGRHVLGFVMPLIREMEERIRSVPGVTRAMAAGSVRRMKETVGDIDIVVAAKDPERVMKFVAAMEEVVEVHASGATKTSVRLVNGMDMDVRAVDEKSFGAALNYFTGSKAHNVALREIAKEKGWKLSEYGLFFASSPPARGGVRGGGREEGVIAGKTEEELYKKLGLAYIEPELREMRGEIEAAREKTLPNIIGYGDLKGDLQIQTEWSDGAHSIETMAREAKRLGLEYIAITDHTKRLSVANGLDEKRIKEQWKEIDRINKKLGGGFRVLKSTECDILVDGALDLPDDILAQLDIVGVAVHSLFHLSRREQTRRIVRAMENPHVDILFHPTGRLIKKRAAYEVDMEEVIKAAKRTGTILEIDAFPDRLDINDEYIRKCVEAGVKMSISSDAHAAEHMQYLEFGIGQARRGWASADDIINTRDREKMKKLLKKARSNLP